MGDKSGNRRLENLVHRHKLTNSCMGYSSDMLDRKLSKQRRKEEKKKKWQVLGEREDQTPSVGRVLSKFCTGEDFSAALVGSPHVMSGPVWGSQED